MQNEAIYDILNQYPEHRDGIPEHYTRDLVEGLGDYLKLVMIDSDKRKDLGMIARIQPSCLNKGGYRSCYA